MIFLKRLFLISFMTISLLGYGYFAFATLTPGQTLDPVDDSLCTGPSDPDCQIDFIAEIFEIERDTGVPASSPTGADPLVYINESTGDLYTYDGSGWNGVGSGSSPFSIENVSSVFLTGIAGVGSNATHSFFVGSSAGAATNASYSNFFGINAGYHATSAAYANFLGEAAGYDATNASSSNFLGKESGSGATNASESNFMGYQAGRNAVSAAYSNFFGFKAGSNASNATYSNFIGQSAGAGALNAAHSIFIGSAAGFGDTVNNALADDYSILIGNNTSTGGFSNSIAIGASATNTASNQFMIGSTTRPINELVIVGNGASCTIDNDIYGNGSTGLNCSSDERLKTNITDLDTGTLEKISQLRTVTYNWNANPDSNQQIGFLAQNLQLYFPQLVREGHDGYLQVNYAGMTPLLVEAIRELDMKLESIDTASQSILVTNGFTIHNLLDWFADAANGITDFFAGRITTNELCIGETCVDESQLQELLLLQQDLNSSQDNVPSGSEVSDTPSEPSEEDSSDNESTDQEVVVETENEQVEIVETPEEIVETIQPETL